MESRELLKILGDIDTKYYDEALGGDSEKPMKIDVSRRPLKWYNVAAPIAACLVLGAGAFALKAYLDRPGAVPGPSASDSVPSAANSGGSGNSGNSGSTGASSVSSSSDNSSGTPEARSFYDEYPMLDADKIPTIADSHGVYPDDEAANMTLDVIKVGEYDLCAVAEKIFCLESDRYDNIMYAASMKLCLVKDGELVSSDYLGHGWLSTATSGWCTFAFYEGAGNMSAKVYDISDAKTEAAVVAVSYMRANYDGGEPESALFGIKDGEISVLYGTDVSGKNPTPAAELSLNVGAVIQKGDTLVDAAKGREYRFNPEAWGTDPYKTPHYTTHFYGIKGVHKQSADRYMEPSGISGTTETDVQNWRSFITNANISYIEVEVAPTELTADQPMTAEQACDIMDLIASADLKPVKEPENYSGGGIIINAFDAKGNFILSLTYSPTDYEGKVSLIYEDNSPRYYFDIGGNGSHLRDLYKLYPSGDKTSVVITEKKLGEDYTIQVVATGAMATFNDLICVPESFISVAYKDKTPVYIALDVQPGNDFVDKKLFEDAITTFEMKDGAGFIVRPILSEGSPYYNHAYFFRLDGGEAAAFRYEYDFATVGPGSQVYVGSNFTISAEENIIIAENGEKYILDFNENIIRLA